MSRPLVFLAGVQTEVDEAYSWYNRRKTNLGEEFLDELRVTLDQIERNPEFPAVIHRDIRHARLKRDPYTVDYRLEPDRIAVVTVHHASRDPKRWQTRE